MVFDRRARRRPSAAAPQPPATLLDLDEGGQGIIEGLELSEDAARRLMALGFLPGSRVRAGRSAPAGDPRVYQVDGAEIALRRETAVQVKLRPPASDDAL